MFKVLPLKTDWSVSSWAVGYCITTMMHNTMTESIPLISDVAAPVARRRLPPRVRMEQFLDAALVEFSERGFAATTMEDIGRRCGLSKGGLYAHFASKDAVLDALLHRSLGPPEWAQAGEPPVQASTREFAQWVVDQLYLGLLERPAAVETLRLLAGERGRAKELAQLWLQNVAQASSVLLADIVSAHIRYHGLPDSVVLREPRLMMTPVTYVLLTQMILGRDTDMDLGSLRVSHAELLCELLDPAARIAAQEPSAPIAPNEPIGTVVQAK